MKTYKDEVKESHQSAFDEAIDHEKAEDEQREATVVVPQVEVPVEDDDFDVVVGDPEPEPEPEKPKEDTTNDVLNKLVTALQSNQPVPEPAAPPKRPEIPKVNVEEVRKNYNDNLHESEDPFSVAMEATQKMFGGQMAQQARVIQDLRKETMKSDPDKKYILDKYGNDVETIVANLPPEQQNHPDVYVYAVNQIAQEHLSEIVEKKAEALIASRIPATVRPGSTTTLGDTQGVTPVKKRRTVKASKTDEVMAMRHGMKLKDYLLARGKI